MTPRDIRRRSSWSGGVFSRAMYSLLVVAGLGFHGCGGSDAAGPEDQGPGPLAPFVGTWDATEFVHTAKDNAALVADIIQAGTGFTLTIEASGRYTATATLASQSQIETGTIRVVNLDLVLTPISPPTPESSVRYTLVGSVMTWDGESEWDFASDGIPEPTFLHIVFQRR